MTASPLTLAALAVAALDDLSITTVSGFDAAQSSDQQATLLTDSSGRRILMKIPGTPGAETDQSAQMLALQTLSEGVRARLPFQVPAVLGQVPIGDTRGVLYEFLVGEALTMESVGDAPETLVSIGAAIATIHGLPTGFVSDAGLRYSSALECRTQTNTLVGRAADTGHLPAAILRRWEDALGDDRMWQFEPTVVHGSLRVDSFLIEPSIQQANVTGVLGWSALSVGDPAIDLSWAAGSGSHLLSTVVASYKRARQERVDSRIGSRAALYSEVELARWLLHGVETHRTDIVSDAIAMLDVLVDSVLNDPIVAPLSMPTSPVLQMDDVKGLLDETPEVVLKSPHFGALETDRFDREALKVATAPVPQATEEVTDSLLNNDEAKVESETEAEAISAEGESETSLGDPRGEASFTD